MTDPISVTVKEAAALAGLSTFTVYELCKKGDIDARYHGRRVLVLFASLKAYIEGLPIDPPVAS